MLSRQVRLGLILTLFSLAGGAVWGYFCQKSLQQRQISLRALLGLILAIVIGLQLGLMFLEAISQIE